MNTFYNLFLNLFNNLMRIRYKYSKIICPQITFHTVMLSCNDGFRPVTFLLEALDEDVD